MTAYVPSDANPQFEELKATIQEGLAELDRGEGQPLDFDEIKRKGRERRSSKEEIEPKAAGSHDNFKP